MSTRTLLSFFTNVKIVLQGGMKNAWKQYTKVSNSKWAFTARAIGEIERIKTNNIIMGTQQDGTNNGEYRAISASVSLSEI